MKRAYIVIPACLGISVTPALAWDWTATSSLSETVELNSNQFLASKSPGSTLGSYSTIAVDAQARTPTSRLILDGDITYQKYWGPGTENLPQTEFRQDGVKARYEVTGKTPGDLTYGEASFRESSTALAVLSNLGFATTAQGFLDTWTARAGIERNLTSLDFATLSARSTYTSYDPPSGGTPFTDSSVVGTWRHRLDANLALLGSSEIEWLSYNNLSNTEILILRDMAGVDATMSPLLSFRGMIGAAYLQASQSVGATAPLLPLNTTGTSGSVADLIADAALTYKLLKNTTLTVTANQTVGPSVIGSLTKSTTIGAGVTHLINSRSSVSFASSATRQSTTSSSDFYSASITYSYQLAREWASQVSYRHLHRTGVTGGSGAVLFDPVTQIPILAGSGPADSDSIMFVLTHNFTLLAPGH